MKILFLIENKYQLSIVRKLKDGHCGYNNSVICALTPFAVAACEKEKLNFVVPENYYTSEEYTEIGKESILRIDDLISLLDRYSQQYSKNKKTPSLNIGSYYSSLIHIAMETLYAKVYQLYRVIDSIRPESIVSFRIKNPPYLIDFDFIFHPLDKLYGELLSESQFKDKCKFLDYDIWEEVKYDKYSLRQKASFFIRHNYFTVVVVSLLLRYRRSILSFIKSTKAECGYFLAMLRHKKVKKAVFLGRGYGWEYLLKSSEFKNKFVSYFFPTGHYFLTPKRKKGDGKFLKELKWNDNFYGFKLAPLLYSHIEVIKFSLRKYIRWYAKIKAFLKNKNCVFAPYLLYPLQHFIAHIANQMDIPVVVWAHGEKGCSGDIGVIDEKEDVLHANYFLSFGPAVSRIYNDKYLNKYLHFKGAVTIGAPDMDTISQLTKSNTSNQYILYTTGKYFLNTAVFGGDIPVSDYKLYCFQKKIVGYLDGLKANRVIWKLHPSPLNIKSPIETKHVERIYHEKSFSDLIKDASLIILDVPSTTCLQAASSNKPLFVAQGYMDYSKEALNLLSKRAIVVNSPKELIEELDFYLKTNNYKADVNNREFVKAFAVYLDDGNSTQRAVDFISSLDGIKIKK